MRRIRKIPFPTRTTIAMVIDGECEFWYFQMFKRNETSLPISIKPEIPQRKALKDQYERVIEQAKHNDHVYWIVDYDVITRETRTAKKGTETPQQEFKKYVTALKKYKNVRVIINNPCLEFWLLLHFETTGKYFDDCESAEKQLKKHLPHYEKTVKYYTREGNDIYKILQPKLKTAISNAKKLKAFDLDNPQMAMAQLQDFFESDEVKEILEK